MVLIMILILDILQKQHAPKNVILVPTTLVHNEKEMMKLHEQYMDQGYEGSIIRNRLGKYKPGHRSNDLLKFKNFIDDEFKIVGYEEATGKDAKTPVWICEVGTSGHSITSKARPKGSLDYRRKLWKNRDSLIGQMVTVEYQGRTDDGKLRFARAKVIRDYE